MAKLVWLNGIGLVRDNVISKSVTWYLQFIKVEVKVFLHPGCHLTDSTLLENLRTCSLTLSGWFHEISFCCSFCCDRNRKMILDHTWIECAGIASCPGASWEWLCSFCWTNDVILKVWTMIWIIRETSAWIVFKVQNSYWVFIWLFRLTHLFKLLNGIFEPLVSIHMYAHFLVTLCRSNLNK